ncbi:MAG TPA: hypothetical protein P5205_04575 [Candidatus Paceibacterota bacterium]|nr:hypothetical protein [Verrucomicrobiota bacterium]HSA09626.1 hypothetical protein [Candidatus Paceibacterota bacterium]
MISPDTRQTPATPAFLRFFTLAAALLWGANALAVFYLQDGFDYPPGILGTYSPWAGPTNLITVVNPGLSCRNVANFSPPGNAVAVNAGGSAQAITYRPLETTVTSGVLYCSVLINYTAVSSSVLLAGLLPSSLTAPGGYTVDPCDLVVRSASGGYNLGIRAKGTTPATYASKVFALNIAHLIVMKYDFTSGRASLFLSPTPGEPEPASFSATSPVTGTPVSNLRHFFLRVYDATAGNFQMDTLRVASTWAEATPWAPAPPASRLAFTTAPLAGTVGAALPAIIVQALDSDTNSVPTNNIPVTLILDSGSFASGTTTAYTDATGKATFSDLVVDSPGTYSITATASGIGAGLSSATTNPFTIGPANAISEPGHALSHFLDSLQVERYWKKGVSVNWLTGAEGGTGPNMTIGTGTHCSAFAAGAAAALGVYLLRPPQTNDLNLANSQADWLRASPAGWYAVPSITDAQHLANAGTLVVASCKETSGSGHIAVLRPSTRSDTDVLAYGPQECQSGVNNVNSTNVAAGFDQHLDSYPDRILYYAHAYTNAIAPVNPLFGPHSFSNNVFRANTTTVVGRKYRFQSSSDFVTWTNLLAFTNSNNSTNFFTITPLTDSPPPDSPRRFYRLLAE